MFDCLKNLRLYVAKKVKKVEFHVIIETKKNMNNKFNYVQIDSSTIDGNVVFVHSQYSCILTSQVSIQFLCPTQLLVIVMILE